jgi:hypothetical protein
MFRDTQESCQITERLLHRNDITHHPFETFVDIVDFFDEVGGRFPEPIRKAGRALIERLGGLVMGMLPAIRRHLPSGNGSFQQSRFTD